MTNTSDHHPSLHQHQHEDLIGSGASGIKPFLLPQDIENASLEDLPSILEALRHVDGESIREAYIARVSKQLKTSKKAIRKDLTTEEQGANPGRSALTAYFPGLVEVCLDRDGEPCFVISKEDSIDMAHEVVIDGKLFLPPDREHLPFKLPRAEEVIRYYQLGPDPSLFTDLLDHLKGFSYLPEPMWRIITGFVHLSYIQDHPDVQFIYAAGRLAGISSSHSI